MASAVFNSFTIPYKVAFEPAYMNTETFSLTNICIDIVFVIDMLISFRTSFIDKGGNEIEKPKDIACRYLKG